MTLFSSFNHIVKSVGRVALIILLSCIVGACHDEDMVDAVQGTDTDGSLTFTVEVPGYVVPTRADGQVSIDAEITTLSLFLFDEKGGFMGIVDAEKKDGASIDSGEKDEIYDTDKNGQGSYQASIPQNTEVVHFIANAPAEFLNLDINRYKGLRAEEVIAPMVTTQQVYWGTSTYADLQQKTFDQEPVILYRNYAKVTWQWEAPAATVADDDADAEAHIVSIDGWTLCNKPQNATVAPFDADAIGETKGPFHFNLADANSRYVCVPMADALMELADGAEGEMVSRNTEGLPQPLPLFDHTTEAYGNKRVFAIFKITTKRGTEAESKTQFYKIELLKDTKENDIVVHREPYDIKRNHIYTINIKGINPDLGKGTFTAAAEGPAANNTLVEVEETLPELQSNTSVLRVENGTVRYIDNLATKYTTTTTANIDGTEYTAYNVNDIQIYYNGPYGITAEWVTDSCHYAGGNSYVPETSTDATLKLQLKEQPDVNGRYTHIVSFYADAFAEGDNSTRHYKEGLIRIRETGAGALSRFVRVYIGNPISFRPLLISSDIPAMTDERLTVAFTVPDEDYLPASLYPIEVRFGSDRIDVEKNLYVDAMKVELDQTEDYSYVYQYENMGDGTWAWNADADNKVANDWGYKYAYTIESSKDAGEHRITLRTVSAATDNFSVMMEGLSTVLLDGTRSTDEANIFNTRELRFKVQPQTTNAEARRIMLDNGLVDTRLTTAYINNLVENRNVSIPYTLGQFNPEDAANGYRTKATTINAENPVTLWVYYRPDDLTPGTWATLNNGVPFVDAEGNSFAKLTATAATDTLDFTINNSNLKNSLVFITARSGKDDATGTHPYGGTYTGAELGKKEHVYTGENADAQAYRSASALVSVLSNWKFNPAVKNEGGTFEYADVYEKKYGSQSTVDTYDFPVRIDRPSGNAATIRIDTEGKLQLIAYPDSPYELTGTELYRRSTGSTISLTLKAEASNQCELTFRPLTFDHSCTITFTNGTGSALYDESEKNTLEVTHTPIAIYSNKYMWLDEYKENIKETQISENNTKKLVDDALFSSSLNVDPEVGQEYVVRIYFLCSDIESVFSESPDAFTFKLSLNCSEVQSPNTESATYNYQILQDGSIQVNKGFQHKLTIDGKQYGYVDLMLKTTKAASSETMRISTADSPATLGGKTAANPIKFYRYSVSGFGNRTIYEAGSSAVKYELLCTDAEGKGTWVTLDHNGIYLNTHASIMDDLYQKEKTAYLRVTYPLKDNDNNKVDEFTLVTSGFHVTAPTGATMTVLDQSGTEVSDPTAKPNNNGYYWTYKFADVPTTNNSFTLTLTTVGYGLADLMKVNAEGFTFVAEQSQFALATEVDGNDNGKWSITKYNGTAAPSTESDRTGEDHAIFDVGTQINGVLDDGYSAPSGYTHASKMDGAACISFYAPYTGMKLKVGLSQRKNKGGTLAVWYNGQKDNSYAANTPTATDGISEFEYTLGAPGLYQLKKGEGSEFFLYYLNLEKNREAYSGAIISQWCAKKLDDTQMTNATWGGTDGTALTDNLIYLSDFAEKLVLTVDLPEGETEATLTLSNTGKYAFRNTDGTKVYSYTVADGTTVELVPASDTDTEIVEGTDIIQLTGYSTNYTYSQNITVKVIPWVQLSTDLYTKYTTKNSNGFPIMQVGDTVRTEFALTDVQHVGKNLQFGIKEYGNNTNLKLISSGGTNINNAESGAASTFIWQAVAKTERTLFQVRGYSTSSGFPPTDVMYNGAFLDDGWKHQLFDLAIRGASITYSMDDASVVGQLPADTIIKESDMTDGSYVYTLPKNFTLYKEGYTLTGWHDGTTTHAPGATLSVSSNVTLTPEFTANSVSLNDRTEAVTITWDFRRNNGAPTINGWEGTDGHVWVAQAEVKGQTIDVKMDVNTTNGGKFANANFVNCAQINGGTTLTIPSCQGATVEVNAQYVISGTTIDGKSEHTEGTTITATVSDNDATTQIVIGGNAYYYNVKVTLPVVENQYTVTYYNEGYTTSDAAYSQFTQQTYGNGGTIQLPSGEPTSSNRTFSHWVTVATNGVRTKLTGGESVTGDMVVYPVWDVAIGASEVTVLPGDVAQVSNCVTKGTSQLIDCAYDDGYILFDAVPSETGWYTFTANIATALSDRTVTLGYESDQNSYVTQNIEVNCDGYWNIQTEKKYDWTFYLTAGNTYTFKMRCNKLSSATDDSGYTANVNSIIVKKGATFTNVEASAVWAFNNIENYATAYTTTPEGVFSSVSVNTGDLTITGIGTGQAEDENGDKVTFVKLKPAGTTTAVEWSVKPTEGLMFTPTKVTGYIQRFGTDAENGVTVTARLADGTSLELGKFTAPRANHTQEVDKYGSNSNYTNQFIIELTAEQQNYLTSAGGFTLSATVGVGSTKEGGFSDVRIYGTVSGTIE